MSSLSFTKLFSSITDSSVWQESDETRLVWITMLSMADQLGRIHAAIPGLAHRARVSLKATEAALDVFLAPDTYSRSGDHEGRRIEKIEGGWKLLNYSTYREKRDPDARKEQNKVAQGVYRSKSGNSKPIVSQVSQSKPTSANISQDKPESAQAEVEGEEEEDNYKNKQKTSRKRVSDARHVPFRLAIQSYTTYKAVEFIWDASEAKQLSLLLSAAPDLTLLTFQACLNHRARSPGTPHGERPRLWLPNVLKYQEAPLNEFGKTGAANGNRNSKTSGNINAAQSAFDLLDAREAHRGDADGLRLPAGSGE
jgi:hypothetical protein